MSQGRAIHSPPTSTPACRAAIRSNHASTPCGSRETASSGPTRAQAGLTLAESDPRARLVRHAEVGRRHPPTVRHDHRPPRQPVAIVDDRSAGRERDAPPPGRGGSCSSASAGPDPPRRPAPACSRASWPPAGAPARGGSRSAARGRSRPCLRPGRDASILRSSPARACHGGHFIAVDRGTNERGIDQTSGSSER